MGVLGKDSDEQELLKPEQELLKPTALREVDAIPTAYGRLVYLVGLRDPNTGRYEYYGPDIASSVDADRMLKTAHETLFRSWVGYSLERKKADVELYIAGLDQVDPAELVDAWSRLTPYKNLVPASSQSPEKQKHISDFEAILGLLKNVYGVSFPDPTA